jgi:predicted CopG family antitoxin
MVENTISMVKTIKLSEETHSELNSVGLRGESFDEIVARLIKFYKEKHKK